MQLHRLGGLFLEAKASLESGLSVMKVMITILHVMEVIHSLQFRLFMHIMKVI